MLPPIGESFMYIKTSSDIFGQNVFCSFERTDKCELSNTRFYYVRFSTISIEQMGKFGIQQL